MRTSASLLFLIVFTLLQGTLPLLHVHVTPSTHAQTGIHLHAAPLATDLPGNDEHLAYATAEESPAITAPAEHRRDKSVFDARLSSASAGFEPALPRPAPTQVAISAAGPAADYTSRARPPTRGPPAFS